MTEPKKTDWKNGEAHKEPVNMSDLGNSVFTWPMASIVTNDSRLVPWT